MKNRSLFAVAVVAAAAAGYGLYSLGMSRGMKIAAAPAPAAVSGKKILYWHDPMVPGQRFDKPGKSPFMDMQLVPVYEGEADAGGVAIDPRMQQSLGVRTAEAARGALAGAVEAVGTIAYDERSVAVVQARASGFVERLYVRAALDPVKKGQALADLYVPDWVAAQEEFLSAKRLAGTSLEGLVDGARQRMRLAGMSEAQIREVEAGGRVQPRLTLHAPIDGVVADLGAREGMTVAPGASLFRLNGLATVWVYAEVPEAEAGRVRAGDPAQARTPALPDKRFKGRVAAVLPEVSPVTRTFKARVELANSGGELKPGMFAAVELKPAAPREVLLVPSEAVIRTGKRSVVVLAREDGRFMPAEVETGREADGRTEIRKGLEAGQKVVVSGQFLIDSEASLKAAETRMGEAAATGKAAAARPGAHPGTGKVRGVDAASGYVELAHDPIPSLKWPAMIMGFYAKDKRQLEGIREGDRVEFDLDPEPNADGDFMLNRIGKKP